jgi:hypothetical protein
MKLIVTIDTEEDNWGDFRSTGYSLENIERISSLQDLFNSFNVKPTYLITYTVATNERCISILKGILDHDLCEIGTHCHPWNTPPFNEVTNERNSMLSNLPFDLQYKKLNAIHTAIKNNFNIDSLSFRAGRWGYSHEVAKNLHRHGYKVDTSISPYTDWTNCHGPDFSYISPKPYRFSTENIFQESFNGHMLEIPATVGFFQKNFALCNYILQALRRKPINKLRLMGILDRLNFLNKVWLSPENSDSKKMIKLTQRMMCNGYRFVNLMFHSTSLKAGLILNPSSFLIL